MKRMCKEGTHSTMGSQVFPIRRHREYQGHKTTRSLKIEDTQSQNSQARPFYCSETSVQPRKEVLKTLGLVAFVMTSPQNGLTLPNEEWSPLGPRNSEINFVSFFLTLCGGVHEYMYTYLCTMACMLSEDKWWKFSVSDRCVSDYIADCFIHFTI